MECVVITWLDMNGYCKGGTRLLTDDYAYSYAFGSYCKKSYFLLHSLNAQ